MATEQKTVKGRPNSRQAILDAATAIVAELGSGHLTLDAVARRAGVSKGGLLYNFPSKYALLAAIIAQHVENARANAKDADTPGGARDTLRRMLEARLQFRTEHRGKAGAGLLGAFAEQPSLLDPVRGFNHDLWKGLRQSEAQSDECLLAWLAIEGLTTFDIFNMNPLSEEEQAHVVSLCFALIDGALGVVARKPPVQLSPVHAAATAHPTQAAQAAHTARPERKRSKAPS